MHTVLRRLVAALFLGGAASASASIAAIEETASMLPDESVLELDVLLAQPTSRVAGMIDIKHEVFGGSGFASIPAIDGLLIDPIDVTIPLGEASVRIAAPANSVTVKAAAGSLDLIAVTNLGGDMYGFDQGGVDIDLAGTVTLTLGSDVISVDLATIGTIVNQTILNAKLTLAPGGNRIEAPVALDVLLPINVDTSLPVSVTGTLVAVVPEPGTVGVLGGVGVAVLSRRRR